MGRSTLDEIIDTKYPAYRGEAPYAGGKDICGYFPLYEKHLPEKVDNFLEIGIAMGISIKMFRDYYDGVGVFHAMNWNWGNAGVINKAELEERQFVCHEGNQADVEFLSTIKTQFDVIIDDGSHRSDHQIITFDRLFNNNLNPGGLYVVEDLHCCIEPYWWGEVTRFEDTLLSILAGSPKTIFEPLVNIFDKDYFSVSSQLKDESIDRIYLYGSSIAFIYKK